MHIGKYFSSVPRSSIAGRRICTFSAFMEAGKLPYPFTSVGNQIVWVGRYISQLFFFSSLKFPKPKIALHSSLPLWKRSLHIETQLRTTHWIFLSSDLYSGFWLFLSYPFMPLSEWINKLRRHTACITPLWSAVPSKCHLWPMVSAK